MRYQQLSLFSRPVTVSLRDHTRARNWSPKKEESRREHARRRVWGLARRHGWKVCRSRGCSRRCGELGLHDPVEAVPPLIWPAEAVFTRRPSSAPAGGDAPAEGDVPSGAPRAAEEPGVGSVSLTLGVVPSFRDESAAQTAPEIRPETASGPEATPGSGSEAGSGSGSEATPGSGSEAGSGFDSAASPGSWRDRGRGSSWVVRARRASSAVLGCRVGRLRSPPGSFQQ